MVFVLHAAGWDGDSWIGGQRVKRRGRWEGNLNGEIRLAYWSSGEPNNDGGNEHCAEIWGDKFYFWNDEDCSINILFYL